MSDPYHVYQQANSNVPQSKGLQLPNNRRWEAPPTTLYPLTFRLWPFCLIYGTITIIRSITLVRVGPVLINKFNGSKKLYAS